MNKRILINLLIIGFIFIGCKRAVYNNIIEGAGGVILGVFIKSSNGIILSGIKESIDEGTEHEIGVKYSGGISATGTIKIESKSSLVTVNGGDTASLNYSADNANVDQFITVKVLEDSNVTNESVEIVFSSEGLSSQTWNFTINDLVAYNIQMTGSNLVEENIQNSISVSFVNSPTSDTSVTFQSSDPALTILTPNLTFRPDNYLTTQTVNYIINDNFNTSKTYSITATTDTESKSFQLIVTDNDFVYKDISASQGTNSGYNPSLYTDSANNYIYIAARNLGNSSKLSLYRCDLEGNNCIHFDASAGQGTNSAFYPKIVMDTQSSIFRILATNRNTGDVNLSLYSCSTDLTSSTHISLSGGTNIGFDPKIVYDSINNKIRVTGVNSINAYYLFCNPDGSGCTSIDLGTYAQSGVGYQARGIILEPNTGKMYNINTGGKDESSFYLPVFKKFDLNGTNIVSSYISLESRIGYGPDMKLDTINSKTLIVSSNWILEGRPVLFKCDLEGANCETKEIASSNPFPTYYPSLQIDTVNQKLLITVINNRTNKLNLFRCDINGDNCINTDISLGKLVPYETYQYHFDTGIDTINNRLLVVFTDKDSGKLSLIRFGLGGF